MVAGAAWGNAEKLLHDAAPQAAFEPLYNIFSHEKEGEADFRLQGTTDFDTEELLLARAKLLKSPLLRKAALAFWDALDKPHYEAMTEQEYRLVHARITRALAPELSEAEAEVAATEDWHDDMGDAKAMTLELYLEGLISIADQWTDTVDELEYVVFMNQLLRRITCRKRADLWANRDQRDRAKRRQFREIHEIAHMDEQENQAEVAAIETSHRRSGRISFVADERSSRREEEPSPSRRSAGMGRSSKRLVGDDDGRASRDRTSGFSGDHFDRLRLIESLAKAAIEKEKEKEKEKQEAQRRKQQAEGHLRKLQAAQRAINMHGRAHNHPTGGGRPAPPPPARAPSAVRKAPAVPNFHHRGAYRAALVTTAAHRNAPTLPAGRMNSAKGSSKGKPTGSRRGSLFEMIEDISALDDLAPPEPPPRPEGEDAPTSLLEVVERARYSLKLRSSSGWIDEGFGGGGDDDERRSRRLSGSGASMRGSSGELLRGSMRGSSRELLRSVSPEVSGRLRQMAQRQRESSSEAGVAPPDFDEITREVELLDEETLWRSERALHRMALSSSTRRLSPHPARPSLWRRLQALHRMKHASSMASVAAAAVLQKERGDTADDREEGGEGEGGGDGGGGPSNPFDDFGDADSAEAADGSDEEEEEAGAEEEEEEEGGADGEGFDDGSAYYDEYDEAPRSPQRSGAGVRHAWRGADASHAPYEHVAPALRCVLHQRPPSPPRRPRMLPGNNAAARSAAARAPPHRAPPPAPAPTPAAAAAGRASLHRASAPELQVAAATPPPPHVSFAAAGGGGGGGAGMRRSCSTPGMGGRPGASSAAAPALSDESARAADGEWALVPQVLAPRAQSHRRAEALNELRPRPRPASWARKPSPKFAIGLFERRTVGVLDLLY